MKAIYYRTLSILIAAYLMGCTKKIMPADYKVTAKAEFKNQGDQEDYWAKMLLNERYKKKTYQRYKGKVVVFGNAYKYGKDVIVPLDECEYFRDLLESGLIYPGVFNEISGLRYTSKLKSAKEEEVPVKHEATTTISLFDRPHSDTLRISGFTELKSPAASLKSRRFKFWLFNPGFANPIVYLIELTNKKASLHNDMRTFIKGAQLTFAVKGWVIM